MINKSIKQLFNIICCSLCISVVAPAVASSELTAIDKGWSDCSGSVEHIIEHCRAARYKSWNWLRAAKTKNSLISLEHGKIYWISGEWFDGDWRGDAWVGGIFYGGTWHGGVCEYGVFAGGTWLDGDLRGCLWLKGTWVKGTVDGIEQMTAPKNL